MLYDATDTIAAITTPLGESGIGAIRISGPDAYTLRETGPVYPIRHYCR